jgi:hypothetical protein
MRIRTLLIPSLALLAGSGAAQDSLHIHGFVSQGYLVSMDNALFAPESEDNGTFEFSEVALNAVATPIDRLRVGIQIAAQDLGDLYNNEVVIDWAYGNYSFGEVAESLELSASAGRFKMGHGLYNDYRDLDMTRTSVFLPLAIYNPRWRDFMLAVNGFGLTASYNAGPLGSFEINGFIGTNNYSADEGGIYDLMADLGMDPNRISIQSTQGGQLTWSTPLDGLRLKYSLSNAAGFEARGSFAAIPGSTYDFVMPNYWDNIWSLEYQYKDLLISAEYNYIFLRGTISGSFLPDSEITSTTDAAYISAAYRVLPKWEVLGGWQWSKTDSDTTSKWYALNAAVRYDITDHWLIKAEYQWTHGTSILRVAEQPDGTIEDIWSYVAIKTTFDF